MLNAAEATAGIKSFTGFFSSSYWMLGKKQSKIL